MPFSINTPVKQSLVNCDPWSELKTIVDPKIQTVA
jgi:hypothetical protein